VAILLQNRWRQILFGRHYIALEIADRARARRGLAPRLTEILVVEIETGRSVPQRSRARAAHTRVARSAGTGAPHAARSAKAESSRHLPASNPRCRKRSTCCERCDERERMPARMCPALGRRCSLYAARGVSTRLISFAISPGVAPIANSDRTIKSTVTDRSAASILATRDWLEPSRSARPA